MMLEWDTYRKQLLAAIGEIGKTSPEVVRGYAGLSGAGAALVYSARVIDAYAEGMSE